jgi:putative alpha-1,2-mannosidase
LQNGKTFTIQAPKNSAENLYIQSAKLNGRKYTKTYLHHEDIIKGGKITFKMDDKPNKQWGTSPDDAPYSMSNENQ